MEWSYPEFLVNSVYEILFFFRRHFQTTCSQVFYMYIYTHSGARKFVNPLEFSMILHKSDLKLHQIRVLIVDKKNQMKQMRKKLDLGIFVEENESILHIYEWQKYVNLCFQYLVIFIII